MELLAQDLQVTLEGNHILNGVILEAGAGELVGIIGPNGSGKSTLLKCLYRQLVPQGGAVYLNGRDLSRESRRESAKKIGVVAQHNDKGFDFTVLDMVLLGRSPHKKALERDNPADYAIAHQALREVGMEELANRSMATLSGGERQRVILARALAQQTPCLILDEPTGVLTPQETAQFFEVLRALQKEGYGIIIITHRMSEIMAISDRVTILRDGKKVAQLVTAETQPDELSRHMIGRELNESYDVDTPPGEETLLSLEAISLPRKKKGHPLHDITLELRRGEILGVAGVEGNGQKELAEIITGIQHPSQGRVVLDGQEIQRENVRQRYERGVVYISDDRLNDSLVTDMDMTENLMLRDYCRAPFSHKGLLDRKAMLQTAKEKIQRYQVRSSGTSGEATPVRLLSGGNQQKLIVAREIHDRAQVVVASQPTRGLDIGATEFVRDRLVEQRNAGKGVLLISADLEEIMALSDRIAVLFGGRIVGVLTRQEATVEKIGLLMGGITGKEAVR